jgi:hypothetical protein
VPPQERIRAKYENGSWGDKPGMLTEFIRSKVEPTEKGNKLSLSVSIRGREIWFSLWPMELSS